MSDIDLPRAERMNYRVLERKFLLPLLLCLTVFMIYGKVLKYPFIQDDWYIFDAIRSFGMGGFLRHIVSPSDNFFYRPLCQPYFLLVYKLFYPDPTFMHIVSLVFHCVNSFLVVKIVQALIDNELIAWCAGFIYAMAVTIHMDSLLWMVGMYDLVGTSLFFLSIIFCIRGQIKTSLLVYILALLTKESTIILLPILFLIAILRGSPSVSVIHKLRAALSLLWMHCVVFVLYLGLRIQLFSSLPIGTDNPYVMEFNFKTVLGNFVLAFRWSVEGISTYLPAGWNDVTVVVSIVILFVLLTKFSKLTSVQIIVLWGWIILGMIPVLFLVKHFFRYYLTYSFVPVIIIVVLGVHTVFISLLRLNKKSADGIVVLLVLISILTSYTCFTDYDHRGYNVPTVSGSNNLIRKGAINEMVRAFLFQHFPKPVQGTTFLFNWVPTVGFGKDVGPQFWYNDTSLHVFEIQEVGRDSGGVYPVSSVRTNNGSRYLDPQTVIYLEFHGERLKQVSVNDFFLGSNL